MLIRRGIDLSPNHAGAHLCLAVALLQQQMALHNTTTVSDGHHRLTRLGKMTSSDLAGVFRELFSTVRLEPNNAMEHNMLGDCYYFIGDTADEKKEYAIATALRGGLRILDVMHRQWRIAPN